MFSEAKAEPETPPQVSLPQAPVANASVIAGSFGTYFDTRLPEPTTGMAVPSTADCIWLVFQFRLMVTSLYGLNSRLLGEPVPVEVGLGVGVGVGVGVPPPAQEPLDVHGCPEPGP